MKIEEEFIEHYEDQKHIKDRDDIVGAGMQK